MRSLRPRPNGDEGFGLILVMGFAATLTALIVTGTAMGISTMQSSRSHQYFESAISVAEAGVDATLAQINTDYNSTVSTDFVTASPCAITAPDAPFPDADTERAWARDALIGLPDACLVPTTTGEYIAVRPTNRRAIYSMAWAPSRASAQSKRRLLKAEYLFAPYKPSNAILTQGALDFSGSVLVDATASGVPANVHTNGDLTGYNNSLQVDGAISASGTLPGSCPSNVTDGCTAAAAIQPLPVISARQVYSRLAAANASTWFDLCPDGTVRTPSSSTPTVPCTGTSLGGSGVNGWVYTAGAGSAAPQWTLPRTAGGPFSGTYYVYQGDAVIGSNGNSNTTWQITVLAEAQTGVANAATCGTRGGNITWKLFNMTPKLPGLQLLADAKLDGSANASAGTGLFLAGHTVDLQSSSGEITGAVVAGNACAAAGSNNIQGYDIHYDGTFESPLNDLIRTSLWLEYPAG